MRDFTILLDELERTPDHTAAVARLVDYFRHRPAADAAWAVRWLTGARANRFIRGADLRAWAAETAGLPAWLFSACEQATDDLAEAAALVLPEATQPAPSLAQLATAVLNPLVWTANSDEARVRLLREAWAMLSAGERYRFHKMVTGTFRPPVPREWLAEALGRLAKLAPAVILQRLARLGEPTPESYDRLLAAASTYEPAAPPRPFRPTRMLEADAASLGDVRDWECTWTRDGARVQLVCGPDGVALWSERGTLITENLPWLAHAAAPLPAGTVIEGELAPGTGANGETADIFLARELLAESGQDPGSMPPPARRARLEALIAAAAQSPSSAPGTSEGGSAQGELFTAPPPPPTAVAPAAAGPLRVAPVLPAQSWPEVDAWRQRARAEGAHGVRLRAVNRSAATATDGETPDWNWPAPPLICEAILVNARLGGGRGSRGPAEFTFAVRHGTRFATVARVQAVLPAEEWTELEAWIARHTTQRFGPVRAVQPVLVFELACDGLAPAPRTQSGVRLERPRLVRWRRDRTADSIPTLKEWVVPGGDRARGTAVDPA